MRTLNSRVSHINARREGGPRWNPDQSAKDNRSEPNLILMCVEHASAIDDPASISAYPATLLREWKLKQFEEHNRIRQGWMIDAGMAREAIGASFSSVDIVIHNSSLNLAGEGGRALTAGGGGGGAIGRGARGGGGGAGGGHRIDDNEYALRWASDASRPQPMDEPIRPERPDSDFYPGAGGGGGGAIGDGASGGDGGGGGEFVSTRIDLTELKRAGLDRVEVVVGQSGSGARLPGERGGDGEHSGLNFLSTDGTVLQSLRLSGGSGGKSGYSHLPEGVAEISPNDIKGGFRITTLMTVNNVDWRDCLMFVLGGGWFRYPVSSFPTEAMCVVVCTARWRSLDGAGPRGVFLSLIDPTGREASCQTFTIPAEATTDGIIHWTVAIGAKIDAEGIWTLPAHSGGFLLADFGIQVEPLASAPVRGRETGID